MEYDAIVVGGGPAGLTAGTSLTAAGHRVLLLDRESFGGPMINIEWIHGYPAAGGRIAGAMLASKLVQDAEQAGVAMELGEVVEIEPYSGCISVTCADSSARTASAVILASGLRAKRLGVPGEDRYQGKGMIHCAMCDAGLYHERVVAVCGGGDAGLIEALYLARFASKVFVIEAQPQLSAKAALQERARAQANVELRLGARPVEILGDGGGVTGIVIDNATNGTRETLDAYGVLVHVGYVPATNAFDGLLELEGDGHVRVSETGETSVPGLFAAGDLRVGSARSVAAAVADGTAAAAAVGHYLQTLLPQA